MSQSFKLGTVLSITTGFLLCEVEQLYKILDFLTGQSLYTHQLPRAADFGKTHILSIYPELEGIEVPDIRTEQEVDVYLQSLIEKGLKEEYELSPMTDFVQKNPIEELIEMRGSTDGIIVADVE